MNATKAGEFSKGVQSYMLRTVNRDLAKVAAMLATIERYSPAEDQTFYQEARAALKTQYDALEERIHAYDPEPRDEPGTRPGESADAASQQVEP